VPARVSGIRPGTVFAPFHYGYWDGGGPGEHPTAANELTLTEWDPVSKQPIFKNAAVKVQKIGDATGPAPAPTTGGGGGGGGLAGLFGQTAPSAVSPNSTQPPGLQPEILASDIIRPGGAA